MSEPNTSNDLLHELIDNLLYITDETDKWITLLSDPIPDPHSIPGHLGRITREGIDAGVSEALALVAVIRYAESHSVTLSAEKIGAIVEGCYKIQAMKLMGQK